MKKIFEWVPLKMILFKDTIFKNGIYLYREPLNNKPFFFTRLMYEIDPWKKGDLLFKSLRNKKFE